MLNIFIYRLKLWTIIIIMTCLGFAHGSLFVTFHPAGSAWAKQQRAPTPEQTARHIRGNFERVTHGIKPASTRDLPNAIKDLLKEQ